MKGAHMAEEYHVGEKIKKLRHEIGISAKVLAEQASISSGMLSQLENGSTQGSVETLRKIAKVLDTTIASLFADENELRHLSTHAPQLVVRKEARKKISFPDPLYKCELLVPDLQGDVEFVLVELEPHRETNELLPHTRGGEEIDMVISGTISVKIGEKCYRLEEGDTIRFNPKTPHKIENKTDQRASYISIITPPSF